jgi:hypothetical protein
VKLLPCNLLLVGKGLLVFGLIGRIVAAQQRILPFLHLFLEIPLSTSGEVQGLH